MNQVTLSEKIQKLRQEHNLSQKDLADKLDVTSQIIAGWESNEITPSVADIVKLSLALGVTTDSLIVSNESSRAEIFNNIDSIESKKVAPNNAKKKSRRIILSIIISLLFMLTSFTGVFIYKNMIPFSQNTNAIEQADASVVTVYCYDYAGNESATGSGFIAFDDKTVITNYHVIESAASCEISTNEDKTYEVESVYRYSEEEDIAILKLREPTGLKTLRLGDSAEIKKGDSVIAIGSPLGIKNTVSQGILSGRIMEDNIEALQFTAPISSGSSGGALFNDKGKVIGITYASYIDGQNLNLAIPIELANNLYYTDSSAISFADFYQSRCNPHRQFLANWIIENGREIDYTSLIIGVTVPQKNGYYVHYFDDIHHYWLELNTDTDTLTLICQTYLDAVMFPNVYTLTISDNSSTANYSAYDIDGSETGETLVRAIGEFDITTFSRDTVLYCTEYDAHNEYFGYGMPHHEFEPIYRAELCGALDWLAWLLEEEVKEITISDIGFTSYAQ